MSSEAENIQCPDCGATVRPGASFCFKCGKHFGIGGAAAAAEVADESVPVPTIIAGEMGESHDFSETVPDIDAAASETSIEAAAEPEAETVTNPVEIKAKQPMPTAASMRRKPKPPREKIEMVWEEPESSSNPIFIIGTVVISVLVLVIVLLVYFLK